MPTRRQVLDLIWRWCALTGAGLTAAVFRVRNVAAAVKRRLLPPDTALSELANQNPAELDAGQLPVTPIDAFETMGLDDHEVDLERWLLNVTGAVAKPLALSHAQLLQLPAVERPVLLICPGFFAYKGLWKGVSIRSLLKLAGAAAGSTHVTLRGPAGTYEKVERFAVGELEGDKLFLAYAVNGQPLPQQHGFPLRLVAEDHYGNQWVKYVETIEVQKISGG